MAPRRDQKKRMGKKHRQASTRPKKGKAPRTGAQMANVAPKKRKALSSKKAAEAKAARTPKRSPERERSVRLDAPRTERDSSASRGHGSEQQHERESGYAEARKTKATLRLGGAGSRHGEREDRELETLASELMEASEGTSSAAVEMPLVAICGRPNVGKSTLFNRITGTRRSIVGDEPGITRDRIYGETEWAGRVVRIVDTGGVVPDDEALIPAEIFRQARVALDEADAIVMVVDGRTELAAPDVELARLLIRNAGGRPLFLAVNKMDSAELEAAAENFRTLGFRHLVPISAEHGIGVADLLDEVWAALPPETVAEEPTENMEGIQQESEEDEGDFIADEDARAGDEPTRERKLRTHGEHVQRETKIAIIGRPNVGKSTLLNALTGTDRAIVSPIAGTTRDAVDEVVKRAVDHGYDAFAITVDTAAYSRRERDITGRFVKPWRAAATGHTYQAGFTWANVDHFKSKHAIPLILKGIATAEDAALCCEHGVDGVYISNHGGRQLDCVPAALRANPRIIPFLSLYSPVTDPASLIPTPAVSADPEIEKVVNRPLGGRMKAR